MTILIVLYQQIIQPCKSMLNQAKSCNLVFVWSTYCKPELAFYPQNLKRLLVSSPQPDHKCSQDLVPIM